MPLTSAKQAGCLPRMGGGTCQTAIASSADDAVELDHRRMRHPGELNVAFRAGHRRLDLPCARGRVRVGQTCSRPGRRRDANDPSQGRGGPRISDRWISSVRPEIRTVLMTGDRRRHSAEFKTRVALERPRGEWTRAHWRRRTASTRRWWGSGSDRPRTAWSR